MKAFSWPIPRPTEAVIRSSNAPPLKGIRVRRAIGNEVSVVLPLVIPTRILDEANVIVALTLYTTALLVREVFEALDAVPLQIRDAATAVDVQAQLMKALGGGWTATGTATTSPAAAASAPTTTAKNDNLTPA